MASLPVRDPGTTCHEGGREETVADVIEIVLTERLLKE